MLNIITAIFAKALETRKCHFDIDWNDMETGITLKKYII